MELEQNNWNRVLFCLNHCIEDMGELMEHSSLCEEGLKVEYDNLLKLYKRIQDETKNFSD